MALHSSMAEALRLTRAGNLTDATTLIQSMLSAGASSAAVDAPSGEVIDLVPERVHVAPAGGEPLRARAGGRLQPRRHVGTAGSIDYLLYAPVSATPGTRSWSFCTAVPNHRRILPAAPP